MDLFNVLKIGFGVAAILAGSVFELVKPKPSAEERQRQEEEEKQRQEEERKRREKENKLREEERNKRAEAIKRGREAARIKREQKEKILLESGIYSVDQMSGREFELFLELCFQKLGYYVDLTPASQDYGADLILTKNGFKVVVQAKRSQKPISVRAVQEVSTAVKYYRGNEGLVITNNRFTKNAYDLAHHNHVKLWSRNQLIELIVRAKDWKNSYQDDFLTQTALAERLGVNSSTLRRRREQPEFSDWSRDKDPENIAWQYHPKTKQFLPMTSLLDADINHIFCDKDTKDCS